MCEEPTHLPQWFDHLVERFFPERRRKKKVDESGPKRFVDGYPFPSLTPRLLEASSAATLQWPRSEGGGRAWIRHSESLGVSPAEHQVRIREEGEEITELDGHQSGTRIIIPNYLDKLVEIAPGEVAEFRTGIEHLTFGQALDQAWSNLNTQSGPPRPYVPKHEVHIIPFEEWKNSELSMIEPLMPEDDWVLMYHNDGCKTLDEMYESLDSIPKEAKWSQRQIKKGRKLYPFYRREKEAHLEYLEHYKTDYEWELEYEKAMDNLRESSKDRSDWGTTVFSNDVPSSWHPNTVGFYTSQVEAILEPLKVRLITKGDAYGQWVGRFFQKGLWNYLQKYPQFRLTGRTIDLSELHGILLRERLLIPLILSKAGYSSETSERYLFSRKGPDGEDIDDSEWVSGDYSAATDGLNIQATKKVYEKPLEAQDYGHKLRQVLRSILYEQMIIYPVDPRSKEKPKARYEGSVFQRNGQLMGSIVSFPILCIVNFLAYWDTFEEYFQVEVDPTALPVLVNGDDILFRCNKEFYRLWLRKIDSVMFKLSLGKNYVHRSILMINSCMFRYSSRNGVDFFTEIPFFNVGILTGQSKVTGRENVKSKPLDALWKETLRGSSDPQRALRRFIHYNIRDVVTSTNSGEYNLFIPRWRGGLGLEPVDSFHITSFQRRLGTLIEERRRAQMKKGEYPHGLALGIVRQAESIVVKNKHFHRLIEVPYSYQGPFEDFVTTPIDDQIPSALLAENTFDPDVPEKVRFPRNLSVLREENTPRMSTSRLLEKEPRIYEVPYDPHHVLGVSVDKYIYWTPGHEEFQGFSGLSNLSSKGEMPERTPGVEGWRLMAHYLSEDVMGPD